jgi:glycosyltransferase involved in cell wall biosynthesis
VNLKLLVEELSEYEDIDFDVVNTTPRFQGPTGTVERVLRSLWQALIKIRRVDVVTAHISQPVNGIPFYLIARLWRKPFVVRWFGGKNYRTIGGSLRRKTVQWLMKKADTTLIQTKALVRMATEDGAKKAVWYSNSRPMPDKGGKEPGKNSCRRFIYVGHIRPYKGISELIKAAEKLNSSSDVSVYGPFLDGFSEKIFNNCKNLKYGGLLSPEEVVPTMKKYDALVMPTKMPTEGYPGVIVEAFAAGIPILATKCGAIPEIVDDSCGILVEPEDAEALYGAMRTLVEDDTLYVRFCEGSRSKREAFSSKFWTAKFVEYCRQVNVH